ncbi:adhesion G protein-coupled receptor E2-like isoform X2 [Narcine bancroftii]|uniref:adhesion G protein-coupled receptor E2-like isoform X2 n=1 Tax=Narcine bancroftii TaxID=1343680 RepID=UPI003831CEF0
MALRRFLLVIYIHSTWNQYIYYLTRAQGCIPLGNATSIGKDEYLSSPCGSNAACHNTIGSFYCTCNEGFYSDSGDHKFTDPTKSICKDKDECLSSPCGSNAACHNTIGSFYCTCKKGFYVNYDNLRSNDPTRSFCKDKDECLSNQCGSNAACHNTMGSFYCTCNKGFYSDSGDHKFTDPTKSICKDYDECYTIPTICGKNSNCFNTKGSFICVCQKGFSQPSGVVNFTGYGSHCEDVDECLLSPCESSTTCSNVVGSYTCACNPGFISSSGGSRLHHGDVCLEFECPTTTFDNCPPVTMEMGPMQVGDSGSETGQRSVDPYCSVMSFLHHLSVCEMLQNEEDFDPDHHLKSVSMFTNQLLGNHSLLSNMNHQERQEMLVLSLRMVESSVMAMMFTLMDQEKKNMSFDNIEVEMEVLRDLNSSAAETAMLSAKGNQLDVHWRSVIDEGDLGLAGVALIAFSQMQYVLNSSMDQEKLQLNSHILTATSTRKSNKPLIDRVNITFQNEKAKKAEEQVVCVALNHTVGGGHWSRQGCTLIRANRTHTVCQCTHFTSFAILMALYNTQEPWHLLNLSLISYIGISISLVCLLLSFVTFLACRAIKGTRSTIHMNLCLCLFLAEMLFLISISQTRNKVVCAIIAGFLHYFFLAVFSWMCLEGIQLYLLVVKVFNADCLGKRHMFPVGYGLPLLVVGISAAIYSEGYGTQQHCWLSLDKHFVWSFLGPVCAILLINAVFYCITLIKLAKRMSTLKKDKPALQKIRSFTLAAIAQLFLLGCTWIFGIFHFRKETIAMAYIFTIVNSFQGMFIFILHCLLNKQVREEYWRCFTRAFNLKGPQYSEFVASFSVPLSSLQHRATSTKQMQNSPALEH